MHPETRHRPTFGIVLIVCAAILWGTTGTAQSFSQLTLSSYWVGAIRLLVSGLFLLLWVGISDTRSLSLRVISALPWRLIIIAALSMCTYNLAFFAGVRLSGVAIGTAITIGSGPVWAGILQAIWMRQFPDRTWWLAVGTAVSGLLIATMGSLQTNTAISLTGISLCLLGGLSYAVYALTTKKLVTTSAPGIVTALVFSSAAIIALPAAYALAGPAIISRPDIVVLLWLGVVATGIAYLFFSTGVQHVNGATAVALALAEPITAVVLAIFIVGETQTPLSLAGMVVVFFGLCLIIRAERRSREK